MSDSPSADPNRVRVYQPPPPVSPPPPDSAGPGRRGGFDPSGRRMLIEFAVAGTLLVLLVVGVVFAGGTIASWMTPWVPLSFDRSIGEVAAEQFSAQAPDCTNPEVQRYVETIARPLLDQVKRPPFEFRFRVADTPEVNAFALPGGFVTVNYGLLNEARSGEEVAGVIGHEIQHALLRHGTKRMLRQMGSGTLLFLLFGGTDLHGVAHLAGQVTGLTYDRNQELEADREGVSLLVAARIDPHGLSTFFERLSEHSLTPPELLSTHPDPGDRAARVEQASRGVSFVELPSPHGLSCHRSP